MKSFTDYDYGRDLTLLIKEDTPLPEKIAIIQMVGNHIELLRIQVDNLQKECDNLQEKIEDAAEMLAGEDI